LCSIVSITHRIITGTDEKGLPIYNKKVQRKPNQTRVNSIRDYLLRDEVASFPSNILVSVPSILLLDEIKETNGNFVITIDKKKINLSSEEEPLYVQIIDGQHRFRGMQVALDYLKTEGDEENFQKLNDFEFVVSFFIDPEIDFQAMLFSTINRTPVKVSQDLVYDLFGLLESDSPQKTALAIALELNALKTTENGKMGPFYKRIRLLGKKEKGEMSPISQGMFIKSIILLISPNLRLSEIERFNEREEFHKGGTDRTIFRDYYSNNRDNIMFKILVSYFVAVRETFIDINGQSYWDIGASMDNPLQRTIGYLALIDVLIYLFPLGSKEKKLDTDFFKSHLSKAKYIQLLNENNETNYVYSSIGRSQLKDDLLKYILQ
jgi:DGQHR domain-containing protein